jgi:hypothetical protein
MKIETRRAKRGKKKLKHEVHKGKEKDTKVLMGAAKA